MRKFAIVLSFINICIWSLNLGGSIFLRDISQILLSLAFIALTTFLIKIIKNQNGGNV